MTAEDKILLITNAAFTILGLVFILYLPRNTLFGLTDPGRIALYAAPAACFFIFLKKRGQIKTALALTWINCLVFLVCTALFIVAHWYI